MSDKTETETETKRKTKKEKDINTILENFKLELKNKDIINDKLLFFSKFVYYLENENDLDLFFDNLYRPNDEKTEFVIKKSKTPKFSFSNIFSNNNEKKISLNTNKEQHFIYR